MLRTDSSFQHRTTPPSLRTRLFEKWDSLKKHTGTLLGVTCLTFSMGFVSGQFIRPQFFAELTDRAMADNRLPEGWVEEVGSDGIVKGWARDLDAIGQPVTVRLYFNGSERDGMGMVSTVASEFRQDWNAWAFQLPIPAGMRNGIRYSVQVYAVDVNNTRATKRLGVRAFALQQ